MKNIVQPYTSFSLSFSRGAETGHHCEEAREVPKSGDAPQSAERGCCCIYHPPAFLVSSVALSQPHTVAQLRRHHTHQHPPP